MPVASTDVYTLQKKAIQKSNKDIEKEAEEGIAWKYMCSISGYMCGTFNREKRVIFTLLHKFISAR
jgi:hypothetical protein